MLQFDLVLTYSTHKVMMIFACDLVSQMSAARVRGANQSILSQELKRTVYGRLGNARHILNSLSEYIIGSQVRARLAEDVQNHHALGRHAAAESAQLGSVR